MTLRAGPHSFTEKTIIFLATGGLIGFAPVAPGTFGTLAAIPLCVGIALQAFPVAVVSTIILILASVWIAHRASRLMAQHDPAQVVIDEFCGMVVALVGIPVSPFSVILGFILFRVFDILKPFPIRWVDKKITGGWGIVLDDVIAGLFANAVLHLYLLY